MIDNNMTTEEVINTFAVKTSAEDSEFGIKYGFVSEYAGYHNIGGVIEAPVVEDTEDYKDIIHVGEAPEKADDEKNPETGAPVFAIVPVLVAAAAVAFKK